jgi:hypothetical protein
MTFIWKFINSYSNDYLCNWFYPPSYFLVFVYILSFPFFLFFLSFWKFWVLFLDDNFFALFDYLYTSILLTVALALKCLPLAYQNLPSERIYNCTWILGNLYHNISTCTHICAIVLEHFSFRHRHIFTIFSTTHCYL